MGQLVFMVVQVGMALVLGYVIFQIGRNVLDWSRNNQSSEQSVKARVISKHPNLLHSGDAKRTLHKVIFQLPGQQSLELRVRGEAFDQLLEGDEGELTFQGNRFLAFKQKNLKN
ncbi:DUF2500 domain-containing protein [Streptococcus moroccensis]|uniref:DUF2500 domain-containing protein n=1 Tax=Streptococcus moroccensis TaxID=1451356 RepID=A0ABT9YPF8_9STRE|nr:DUF2500 domain-containing protein [Streptococcus moroccensis]MDQ0221881.1 hypothetical protein [Streptococcus moroccensis]